MSGASTNRLADILATVALALTAIGAGAAITSYTADQLDGVRKLRTKVDVKQAFETQTVPRGELTIVKETESAKYHFLNKRSYVVHTASTARVGTVLRGADTFDKARADRHSEIRRTERPIETKLADGSWRVTVVDGKNTAELVANPPLIPTPSPWTLLLGGFALFAGLGWFGRMKLPGTIVWPAAALGLLCVALLAATQILGSASQAASTFLSEGGRAAPTLSFPPAALLAWTAGVGILGAAITGIIGSPLGARGLAEVGRERFAYGAITPAVLGLFVLTGLPFFVGMGLSLFHHEHGRFTFVGLQNFVDIMAMSDGAFLEPRTLPYSLTITIVWTTLNVFLHLSIGLALALLLQGRAKSFSKIYRVFLIVPWAVPSYLTALIWRSMFDADVGVVNKIFGLEGMSWMHGTLTAFTANLVTNVWLGVPFMMVVCLGALTSIPSDLYEAADVDGATRWQQLVNITIPLLKPALLPALILGSIWTFNKFEVIYLVSEGRPDGATDILVTESYRWAFERGLAQGGAYGYAAAYSVIIFVVLLVYSWMTARVSRSAEEALR